MKERLQKIVAAAGLASRRQAETWITAGRVTVNGRIAELGESADPQTDKILVDGKRYRQTTYYVLLNKPRLCDPARIRKARLRHRSGQRSPVRLNPVAPRFPRRKGLLLTNDGDPAYRPTHPSHEIDKTYLVGAGELDPVARRKMEMGCS
jgi:23S rRNA pseudouridine2605 synthase